MTRTLPTTESLTVEFKSDQPGLSDEQLILAVVCLANTEGGHLYLGIEDDGRVTGLQPRHQDPTGMAALIGNRTVPPLSVRVNLLREDGLPVAEVEVPRSSRAVASQRGTLQRRRIRGDGTPECVPFYPHELVSRQSDLGLLDYSALPVRGAALTDLDPLERARLRQAIERYHGDAALLGLDDAELDGALGLTERQGATRVPTVTGLLLLGTEAALRNHLPTHEVAFQVRDDTEVRVNDFYRGPLLRTFERIEEQFSARLVEREVAVGMFRVPIPDIDRRAFREAVVNALTHGDWARLGAVHVRWETDGLVISNPGGAPGAGGPGAGGRQDKGTQLHLVTEGVSGDRASGGVRPTGRVRRDPAGGDGQAVRSRPSRDPAFGCHGAVSHHGAGGDPTATSALCRRRTRTARESQRRILRRRFKYMNTSITDMNEFINTNGPDSPVFLCELKEEVDHTRRVAWLAPHDICTRLTDAFGAVATPSNLRLRQ